MKTELSLRQKFPFADSHALSLGACGLEVLTLIVWATPKAQVGGTSFCIEFGLPHQPFKVMPVSSAARPSPGL